MVGYMVATHAGGMRNFYMVDHVFPNEACLIIDKATPTARGAHALTRLSDDTLEYYEVPPNGFWLCLTMRDDGRVTSSQFDPNGRGKKKKHR